MKLNSKVKGFEFKAGKRGLMVNIANLKKEHDDERFTGDW
jgi:hypothetical protein